MGRTRQPREVRRHRSPRIPRNRSRPHAEAGGQQSRPRETGSGAYPAADSTLPPFPGGLRIRTHPRQGRLPAIWHGKAALGRTPPRTAALPPFPAPPPVPNAASPTPRPVASIPARETGSGAYPATASSLPKFPKGPPEPYSPAPNTAGGNPARETGSETYPATAGSLPPFPKTSSEPYATTTRPATGVLPPFSQQTAANAQPSTSYPPRGKRLRCLSIPRPDARSLPACAAGQQNGPGNGLQSISALRLSAARLPHRCWGRRPAGLRINSARCRRLI